MRFRMPGTSLFGVQLGAMGTALAAFVEWEHRQIAKMLARGARAEGDNLGGVHRKATPAITATKASGRAAVRLDGQTYPWALGAEFGGGKYGAGNPKRGSGGRGFTTQFPPYRTSKPHKAGYMLYPTLRDNSIDIQKRYERAVRRATRRGGFI